MLSAKPSALDVIIWWAAALLLAALVVLGVLSGSGCGPNRTAVVYEPGVTYAPGVVDTWHAVDVVSVRWPEMRPLVKPDTVQWWLDGVEVHYSSDQADFNVPINVPPGGELDGWQLNDVVYVRCNANLDGLRTNALVHEFVHVMLQENGENSDHTGPNWTPKMYDWIKSVQNEL